MEITRLDWNALVQSKKDQVTVEHIYPQTAKSADWPAFSDLAKKERVALLNSLGNLLPLSNSRNAKFSNRPFAIKKQDANGVQGYYNGSYSEIQVAQHQDWTPEMIKKVPNYTTVENGEFYVDFQTFMSLFNSVGIKSL